MLKVIFKAGIISSILLVMASCSPSESSVATAIALTEVASPSDTPTAIPSPTSTPLPSPTYTPVPSPTPTPDTRVYDVDPRRILLERLDLPSEAGYYLPHSSWISPHRNSEIQIGFGGGSDSVTSAEAVKEYLAETGRVDGWWVSFKRGSRTVIAPEEIFNNPVLYKTQEGAMLMLTKYHGSCDEDETPLEIQTIGDASMACMWKKMQNNGKNRVSINIRFIDRNVYHNLSGWGWESEVTLEYVEQVAMTLLDKLQQFPLSNEVTFQP